MDDGRVPSEPGSREPSPSVSAASGFDPSRVAAIAKGLSPGMRLLLERHAEGWRSSLYYRDFIAYIRSEPYWAGMECPYPAPNFMVREALVGRRLIEHYSDAAGITPLGQAVVAYLRDSDRSGEAGETGTGSTEGESAGRQASPEPHPISRSNLFQGTTHEPE